MLHYYQNVGGGLKHTSPTLSFDNGGTNATLLPPVVTLMNNIYIYNNF